MPTDTTWGEVFVSVSMDVSFAEPVRGVRWDGTVYFVRQLTVKIRYFSNDPDAVSVGWNGTAVRALKTGEPGKSTLTVNQYTFPIEPEEIGAVVAEAKRRAERHR